MANTAPTITGTRQAEIIGDLNGVLAHLIDISTSAKQAHWNVYPAHTSRASTSFSTQLRPRRASTVTRLLERCVGQSAVRPMERCRTRRRARPSAPFPDATSGTGNRW
ncbi:MAG: hypothetical protein U5Q44_12835 [Dehalococcoidia bacterium]|nr:hypothetical protein [Dehalococcoidia bacterium]